MFQYGKYA